MNCKLCYHHLKGSFSRSQFPITVVLEDSSLPVYNAVTLDKEFLDSLTSKFEGIVMFRNVCSLCDLCGEQSGTGRGFSLPPSVSPFSIIPSMLHIHS